jgi:hypothetical protein
MAKKKYEVQWNLEHDCESFVEGDSISLEKREAEP